MTMIARARARVGFLIVVVCCADLSEMVAQ